MATQLKDEASIEQILREMTVREKAACITGSSPFYSRALEKYGIPKILLLDGGTGYNAGQKYLDDVFQDYAKSREASGHPIEEEACTGRMGGLEIVLGNAELWNGRRKKAASALKKDKSCGCYPSGMFFGATWNPDVIEACGHALGEEANVRGIDVLLGTPNVNIHRDPLNGRLFEGYSEDPCLVSRLAPSFVKGVQAEGVVANVKHFAANNQETDRMGVNERIPERALREIYLPGFRACVQAGCQTVMTAYNRINGIPCAQNRWLLQEILRGEWGFKGCVVTDWSAAYDQVEACAAGNDLVMPGPRQLNPLVQAVENGTLREEQLDACVRNFLKMLLKTPAIRGRKTHYDRQKGIQAAYNAAKEGITLLKNDGVLPLKQGAKLAFFGARSRKLMDSGAGSAAVVTDLSTNVYDCAAAALGADSVRFEEVTGDTTAVIVTVGANGQEGADRLSMTMEPEDRASLDAAVAAAEPRHLPVIVLLNIAGPIEMEDWEPKASAILCLYVPGMQGGQAACDILLGKVNPSGKLPITFPRKYRDCPTYGNFPGYNSEVWYGEGIYVGYRYYEKKDIPVMYPFGYGLSYTTFSVTEVQAPETVHADSENLRIRVRVRNTGSTAGAEVVQLYVHAVRATLDKPLKELKAFQKVFLEAGEEKELCLELRKEDFASYDCRLGAWAAEPGEFDLMIGNASDHVEKTVRVKVQCENPYAIGPHTGIGAVVANPDALQVVERAAGITLREVAGSYIVFQPLTEFESVWNKCVLPAVHADANTSRRMLDTIYAAWKRL